MRDIDIRIPLYEPSLGEEEVANVVTAVRSGWVSSLGSFVPEFEREFAAFCGARFGIAVCNGTAALHLALLASGVGEDDEVLVPSLTYVATANAVRYCGATPVFVDADPAIWCMQTEGLDAMVTPRTRAIVPVHLYGHPCDMDAILELARRRGLVVIEDAAEAHGAEYRGRRVGALGAIGCFSFYGNKIITTGEGGMCVTDDARLAERLRSLRDHAMDPERHYWHEQIGYSYRMTNLQAALGVAQMGKIVNLVERKRRLARWYAEMLAPLAAVGRIQLHPEAPWAASVYWLYSVLVRAGRVSRDEARGRLDARGEHRPAAEDLGSRGISLPSGADLDRNQVARVVRALGEALDV